MKRFLVPSTVVLLSLTAAAAATMSVPVIRSAAETIAISTRLTEFADVAHRVGVSCGACDLSQIKIELTVDGGVAQNADQNFSQGTSKMWFGVEPLESRGFFFEGKPGENLALKVELPRQVADEGGPFYIFASKNFGQNIWYIVAGEAIRKGDW